MLEVCMVIVTLCVVILTAAVLDMLMVERTGSKEKLTFQNVVTQVKKRFEKPHIPRTPLDRSEQWLKERSGDAR